MRWARRFLALVAVLGVALVGFLLAIDNPEPVSVTFLTLTSSTFPLFAWLIGLFLTGLVIGFAACFIGFVRGKSTERRLKRELASTSEELQALRSVSLRD